eukprot:13995309-Ditylum_brightwellii.AAC.1
MDGHMSTYTPTQHQLSAPPLHAKFTPTRKVCNQVICTYLTDSFLLDHQTTKLDHSSFATYLDSLDPVLKQLLGNLPHQDIDTDFWISALQSGTVTVASDGSVKMAAGHTR